MPRETVTRVREIPGGTDQYGDPIPGVVDELDIRGCALAPRATIAEGEDHSYQRDSVVWRYDLYAPHGADIRRNDAVIARGQRYRVEAMPHDWRSPYTSRRPGVVVVLQATEG